MRACCQFYIPRFSRPFWTGFQQVQLDFQRSEVSLSTDPRYMRLIGGSVFIAWISSLAESSVLVGLQSWASAQHLLCANHLCREFLFKDSKYAYSDDTNLASSPQFATPSNFRATPCFCLLRSWHLEMRITIFYYLILLSVKRNIKFAVGA